MSKSSLWFGFLDAGSKSSPVVLDARLDTGDPQTLYLFNQHRSTILEYRREIVEAKLRELADGEGDIKSLRSQFQSARRSFTPRGGTIHIPETAPAARPSNTAPKDVDPPDDDIDVDDIELDDDLEDDDDWDDDGD